MLKRVSCVFLVALFIVLMIAVIRNRSQYLREMSIAEQEYHASRVSISVDHESFAFVTRGVTAGMPEDAVNKQMADPQKTMSHLSQHDPEWSGYVNVYEFAYGNRYNSLLHEPKYLLQEIFWVYFDSSGSAQKIIRFLHRNSDAVRILSIDLRSKKIEAGLSRSP